MKYLDINLKVRVSTNFYLQLIKSLDCGYDVRGGFVDNSKAFDKIQYNGV